MHERPHSDVELATLVEQGPFNILLNHPLGVGRLLVNVAHDVSDFAE